MSVPADQLPATPPFIAAQPRADLAVPDAASAASEGNAQAPSSHLGAGSMSPLSFDEPMSPAQILFSLRGRIPRRIYWRWGFGALLLGSLMGTALLTIAGFPAEQVGDIVTLVLLWPGIATAVKRCHDRNKAGWWALLYLVPVVGALWFLIEALALPGTPGPNRWGPDPWEHSPP